MTDLGRRPTQPPITFGTTVGAALRKSFRGTGRSSRSEFWLFFLFYLIMTAIPVGIANKLDVMWLAIFGFVAVYVLLIPFITAGIRRLHDTGRSGAWFLLLPTFLFFIVLILWTEPSQPHANRFGP